MRVVQLVFLIYFILAPIASAQVMDYGVQLPKLEESSEIAGIESYRVIRESEDVSVEVFGPSNRLLAGCELKLTAVRAVIECTLAVDGKRYRTTYDLENETGHFEDLNTGDYIIVSSSHPPTKREIIHLEPGQDLPRAHGEFRVKGTKTMAEAQQVWGHVMPLLRLTLAEVKATLGTPVGNTSTSKTRGGIDKILLCEDPFCNSLTAVPGRGVEPFSLNACCSEASQDADLGCRMHTGVDCCANSICTGTCFILCSCDLFGFIFDCPVCT